LAHVGFESIYRRAALKVLGVDPMQSFFTAEALLAWNRMGNLQGVGGPPSQAFLDGQVVLQHFILKRMVELGIAPVLHGFNGFVPREAVDAPRQRLFASQWFGFTREQSNVQRLAPSNLSRSMAHAVAREHLAEFAHELAGLGTVYFSLDVFNENAPNADDDLAALGAALVDPLRLALGGRAPKVVMQLWFLAHHEQFWTRERAHAFLGGFPQGSLVLLDLHGERRPQWKRLGLHGRWAAQTGHALVWCVLHNFGGANGLGGEVSAVERGALEGALQAGHAGVGVAPEGFGANELEFDAVLGAAWTRAASVWVAAWVRARYRAQFGPEADEAWLCALGTVYNRPESLTGYGPTKSVVEMRPASSMRHKGFQPTAFAYALGDFARCPRLLLGALERASPLLRASVPLSKAYEFDVVDWTRQLLADTALEVSVRLDAATRAGDAAQFARWGATMLALVDAMAAVLCMHDAFSRSLADAQARKLVTLWHEDTHALSSYASRQLAALMPLYRRRWAAYLARQPKAPRLDWRAMELAWAANATAAAEPLARPFSIDGVRQALALCDEVGAALL